MDVGGTNIGGVATGIVSNPMLERRESRYLSADVAVASGSSGGPIFSLKDASVIGVVQMVATVPGLGKDQLSVSSTGYLCLAAPASLLRDWLGLLFEDAR
jgi:S1-C subfamily serine protease